MYVKSPEFEAEGQIPGRFTCDGEDISPALEWGDVPPGTKSLALVVEDPDAPRGPWIHWLIYGLPPDRRSLPENVPGEGILSLGGGTTAMQGLNTGGDIGYGGPCPGSGRHRYFFRLYALDEDCPREAGLKREELFRTLQGHVLAEAEYMGTYARAR